MIRTPALLLILELGMAGAAAQGVGQSPYSAYGLGDLVPTGQATQALSSGTGLAITEPYSLIPGNPASYAFLARPVFEGAVTLRSTRSISAEASNAQLDGQFMGFSVGVPFAQGKWGLGIGLAPYTDVGYASSLADVVEGDPVTYAYSGSGGLDRAFLGLGTMLYQQRTDSVGNVGTRLALGADFNFIFGSIEQTREAIRSHDDGYSNTRAFSSLFLAAPTADASLLWQGDLTKKRTKDDANWRWSIGLSTALPANFKARYSGMVASYTVLSGIETGRDTIEQTDGAKGRVEVPVQFGAGLGVQNARWAFSLELHQQDWSATVIEVPGYPWGSTLRTALTYAAAARFRPGGEGGVFQRSVYRLGVKQGTAPQEVRGHGLQATTISGGISIPLNAVQTNSWLHVGLEFGQRGTTEAGLLQERHAALWIGLAFTPWRGERWFTPAKIQ
ncbi:MAG: hypothetical protein KBH07_03720 [Flavobacteriales bacterium]|nr:hypothetical protein [Flavobacteriales bacterium]MBP9079141.1 hypothetical protein [Flavobacteriales bacterium]